MSTDVCTNVFYSDTASPVITTDDIKPELTVNVPFSLPYVHATTVAMMASGERKRKQEDDAVEGASSSSSESSESSSSHKKRKRKHQHSREGKSRKNSKRSLHSRDEPGPRSTDAKPRSKKQRREERSASSASSDSSSDRRQKKEKRRHKEKEKKRAKRKKNRRATVEVDDDKPYFGKYGILRASDFHKKSRSFTVWLEEVKSISDAPKYELQNYFKEYMEDFNTA